METEQQESSNLAALMAGAALLGATIGGLIAAGPVGLVYTTLPLIGGYFIAVGIADAAGWLSPVADTTGEEDS